jgi:hypothetical protein
MDTSASDTGEAVKAAEAVEANKIDTIKIEAAPLAASAAASEAGSAASWVRLPDISFLRRAARSLATSLMAALAARPRLSRVSVLAVSIALAAAAGSMVGAWAAVTFVRPPAAPAPTMIADADKDALAKLSADIAALKAGIDTLSKHSTAQLARLGERVERSEKTQGEPSARIARLADAVEKLERRAAGAPPAHLPAVPETTGSIAQKQQDRPPVVSGWVLREIRGGAALVESRYGFYEAVPGANLPGLGRVETIRRQDGRWTVVTPKGVIVSAR